MEFRRALFCTFNGLWRTIAQARTELDAEVAGELLLAALLSHLAVTNIRAAISPRVAASDASESGGGTCASIGLTTSAHELISKAASPEQWQLKLAFMNQL